jgi:methionine synthase II (cobalamin-independent)
MDARPKEVIEASERYKRGEISRAERDAIFRKAGHTALRDAGLRSAGGREHRLLGVKADSA